MAEERSKPFSLEPGPTPGPRRRRSFGWIWLAGGALAGVGITLLVQGAISAEEQSASNRLPVVRAPKEPAVKQPEKPVVASPPSQGPPPPQAIAETPAQEKQPASQQPPPEIHGTLPSAPVRPVNPVVIEKPAEKDAPKTQSRLVEVSVRVHQTEGDETRIQIEGLARSAGGTARTITIPKTTREREREVALLIVPESKVDEIVASLLTISLSNLRDDWKGPASDLPARIDRPFRDALADLMREERDLDERFLEDAPQLRDVKDRIETLRRQIDSLPTPPSGSAAIRVLLGYRV